MTHEMLVIFFATPCSLKEEEVGPRGPEGLHFVQLRLSILCRNQVIVALILKCALFG